MHSETQENRRFAFTKTRLMGLPVPDAGRVVYHDAQTPGLILRITERGQRSFSFYKKVRGRPVRWLLGTFPAMTVEQARTACRVTSGAVAQGKDIQGERQAARHEQTVGGLFAFWLDTHAKQHKRTWQEDERQYNSFLKPWANRKLSSIKKADVQALHAKVGTKNGRYSANRLMALLSAMYGKADDIGYRGANPCKGITKFKETSRDRWLQGEELQRFFAALETEPNRDVRDYFLMSLFAGARKGNILSMRWVDVNLDTALWRIPGEDAKAGQPIVIPLVEPLVALLRDRHARNGTSPWVFPNRKGNHMAEPRGAWSQIIKRAEISDVRPHDLRRTLGSWQAMTGATLPIIGKMLGHRAQVTTAIYARLDVSPVRVAAERAVGAMITAAGGIKMIEMQAHAKEDEEDESP